MVLNGSFCKSHGNMGINSGNRYNLLDNSLYGFCFGTYRNLMTIEICRKCFFKPRIPRSTQKIPFYGSSHVSTSMIDVSTPLS